MDERCLEDAEEATHRDCHQGYTTLTQLKQDDLDDDVQKFCRSKHVAICLPESTYHK